MFQVILGFVILTMLISLYATYQSAARPNKNILLGFSLTGEYANHNEVIAIVNHYKKGNHVLLILFSMFSLPIFIVPYTSFIIGYLTVWFALYMLLSNYFLQIYSRRLLLVKSRNRWFSSDTGYHDLEDNKLNAWYKKHRLLTDENETIYIEDDDKYWVKGYYCNPFDKRTMVEKRVGIGTTLNMASKGAKVFNYGMAAFLVLFLGGLICLFARIDFATFDLTVKDGIVTIQAPFYGYQFDTDDMEQVTLLDSMPEQGTRTNGAATDKYLLGNFKLTGYGKAKVYVYKEYTPYIMIKLKDLTIFYNTKSEDNTMKCYELLMEKSLNTSLKN